MYLAPAAIVLYAMLALGWWWQRREERQSALAAARDATNGRLDLLRDIGRLERDNQRMIDSAEHIQEVLWTLLERVEVRHKSLSSLNMVRPASEADPLVFEQVLQDALAAKADFDLLSRTLNYRVRSRLGQAQG